MNRPYTAHSPYSLTPTERIPVYPGDAPPDGWRDGQDLEYEDYGDDPGDDYADAYGGAYGGAERLDEERIDRRWMWIAGTAGVILFFAIGTTGIILGGGDSGSVTVSAPTTSAAPVTTSAPAATTPPSVARTLPPETVTTVSPTAEAPPSPTPTVAAPPPVPAPSPRTITYRVTGNRQLIDLVTVIYTDAQGALQTDINVALPWAKTVVLNPGVELKSVTATSVAGQLNCSITDAGGALIAAQNNNAMIASCTQ